MVELPRYVLETNEELTIGKIAFNAKYLVGMLGVPNSGQLSLQTNSPPAQAPPALWAGKTSCM